MSLVLGEARKWRGSTASTPAGAGARSLLRKSWQSASSCRRSRMKRLQFRHAQHLDVDTDRGETQFVLKGEEDIRRLGATSLLIADNHGIHFLIRDMFNIDKTTRKMLDRFL
jgi:hypothetical protein